MDRLAFYELEELLDSLKALADKEEEERKNAEKGSNQAPSLDRNALMRKMTQQSHLPKIPNFNLNNFKL